MKARRLIKPVSPGEMLLEEFMKPLGLTRAALAREIRVPVRQVSHLIRGKRAMTADTALRLEQYLRWPARMWMQIQAEYDLETSRRAAKHKRIYPHPKVAAAG